jgi:hypothetical protein
MTHIPNSTAEHTILNSKRVAICNHDKYQVTTDFFGMLYVIAWNMERYLLKIIFNWKPNSLSVNEFVFG